MLLSYCTISKDAMIPQMGKLIIENYLSVCQILVTALLAMIVIFN